MAEAKFMADGATALVFTVNPRYPGRTTLDGGSVRGLTEGGQEYVYKKGRACLLHELKFEGMPASDFDGGFDYATSTQAAGTQSLVNWFLNVHGQDHAPFTYQDPFGNTHSVMIVDDRLSFALTDYGLYDGVITLKQYTG